MVGWDGRCRRLRLPTALALVALALATAPRAAVAVQVLDVTPSVASRGARISVSGTTDVDGAQVRLTFDGVPVGELTASGRSFSAVVRIPVDAGFGTHTVTACELPPTDAPPPPTDAPTTPAADTPSPAWTPEAPTTEPSQIPTLSPPIDPPPPPPEPPTQAPVTEAAADPPASPPTATEASPAAPETGGVLAPAAGERRAVQATLISARQECAGARSAPVTIPNRAPRPVDDAVATLRNTPARIELTANDHDPDGPDGLAESVALERPPLHGIAEMVSDGVVLYTPASDYVGADGLSYRLCEEGECAVADVSVVVEDDAFLIAVLDQELTASDVRPLAELPPLPGSPTANPSYVSPDRVVAQQARCSRSPLAWGGHRNGQIPADQLAAVGGGHLLERAAAGAFVQLRAAAAGEGVSVGITDSYRSYAGQVEVRLRKGHLVATATPGTSVHGWAKALDLVVREPAVRSWLERNGARFGWVNPVWAKRPGKSFEPWHYEFAGGATGSAIDPCGREGTAGPVNRAAEATVDPVAAAVSADPPAATQPGGEGQAAEAKPTPTSGPDGEFAPSLVGISRWNQVGIGLGALAAAAALLLWGWDVRRDRGSPGKSS
jgi:hypothetical protein